MPEECVTHSEIDYSVIQTCFKENPIGLGIGRLDVTLGAIGIIDREGKTTFDSRDKINLTNVESESRQRLECGYFLPC